MFRSKFFISTFYSEHFGVKHHKYSDALLDYGFFLLNIDAIAQSVEVSISFTVKQESIPVGCEPLASVATTRWQCRLNKFEQVSSDDGQMLVAEEEGIPKGG